MSSFALIVTRLVPLLLLLSVILILARVIGDRAGKGAFTAIVAVAAVIAIVALLQTGAAVFAHEGFRTQHWERADASYRAYSALRGRLSREMAYEWAVALMHGARWRPAIAMLERTGTPSPRGLLLSSDTTLLIGECLYYSGDLKRGEVAIRVAKRARRAEVRDYFLARIAERNAKLADAVALYASSIARNPRFYPAVYHHARTLVLSGAAPKAVAELDAFRQVDPSIVNNASWRDARDAASRGAAPVNMEFYVLEA